MLQLGSLHGDDEAEPDPQFGRHADDPCPDPDVGHVQPRGWQGRVRVFFSRLILLTDDDDDDDYAYLSS